MRNSRLALPSSLLLLTLCFTFLLPIEAKQMPAITLEPIITGLSDPIGVVDAMDSSGRLFIVLQSGKILIFDGKELLPTPFLDIHERVRNQGEMGLLGLDFHPQYQTNGFFYVNYINNHGQTSISRFHTSTDKNIADTESEFIILTIDQPFSNHNGGQIQFGPDGFLYIATGDGGSGGDPQNRAQNLNDLLGKILRIDVNTTDFHTRQGRNYAIPENNPFITNPEARDEIWVLGLRNPWRFSFDHLTGTLFIGDVGQGTWEEVNIQPTTSSGGENYGWRLMEGTQCFEPEKNCSVDGLTLPIISYPQQVEDVFFGCAIIGGYQYRGTAIPKLFGMYIYADFCSGKIWGARESNGQWHSRLLLNSGHSITSFGEDENGTLYVSDTATGSIFRIADPSIAGCIIFNHKPLSDHKVNLRQLGEEKKKARTDIDGCFTFDHVTSGKRFEISIKGKADR